MASPTLGGLSVATPTLAALMTPEIAPVVELCHRGEMVGAVPPVAMKSGMRLAFEERASPLLAAPVLSFGNAASSGTTKRDKHKVKMEETDSSSTNTADELASDDGSGDEEFSRDVPALASVPNRERGSHIFEKAIGGDAPKRRGRPPKPREANEPTQPAKRGRPPKQADSNSLPPKRGRPIRGRTATTGTSEQSDLAADLSADFSDGIRRSTRKRQPVLYLDLDSSSEDRYELSLPAPQKPPVQRRGAKPRPPAVLDSESESQTESTSENSHSLTADSDEGSGTTDESDDDDVFREVGIRIVDMTAEEADSRSTRSKSRTSR